MNDTLNQRFQLKLKLYKKVTGLIFFKFHFIQIHETLDQTLHTTNNQKHKSRGENHVKVMTDKF